MSTIQKTQKNKGDLVLLGGQILFDENDTTSIFQLLTGEVLVLRNGQAIDLLEAGEVLDAGIWSGATAVAWTDCVLQTIELPQPPLLPYTHSAVIDRHLALAA